METLQTYLDTQYKKDCGRRTDVLNLIRHVLPLFTSRYEASGWPYEYVFTQDKENQSGSTQGGVSEHSGASNDLQTRQSENTINSIATVAMIAGALQRTTAMNLPEVIYEVCKYTDKNRKVKSGIDSVKSVIKDATKLLLMPIVLKRNFKSSTYGEDSVFVLSWLLELFAQLNKSGSNIYDDSEEKRVYDSTIEHAVTRIGAVFPAFETPKQVQYNSKSNNDQQSDSDSIIEAQHAFPLLKAIRMYEFLTVLDPDKATQFYKYLDSLEGHLLTKIHHNIGLSTLDNSQFDAAELAFSLEGYLLIRKIQFHQNGCENHAASFLCDKETLDRVFSILSEKQAASTYWVPLKPFVTQKQGFTLSPLSVEIVLSLLRTCKLSGENGNRVFTEHSKIFERYLDWVMTRITAIPYNNDQVFGWSSEHTCKNNVIHIWQSSQVLLFLAQYYDILCKKIAADALTAANLSVIYPKAKDEKLANFWKTEPYGSKLVHKEISKRIADSYDQNQSASFLLYGPPGTGKTFFAEQISRQKRWPLLELSPSDFIADGVDQLENKAKNLFTVLYEQRDLVIIFDEIDRLLLNRDSEDYKGQGDMFQVMVASLLVKFKKLRETPHIIFLICTNYKHRLDPAIIRAGRIDLHVLVLPPDKAERNKAIEEYLTEKKKSLCTNIKTEDIASATPLFSYGELKEVTKKCCQNEERQTTDLQKVVESLVPTISLSSYLQNIYEKEKDKTAKTDDNRILRPANELPIDEIFMIAYALYESGFLTQALDEDIKRLNKLADHYKEQILKKIRTVMGPDVEVKIRDMIPLIKIEAEKRAKQQLCAQT